MNEIRDRHGNLIGSCDDLNGMDFDSANLQGTDLSGRIMEGANFSDANMINSNLEGCDLYWAIFFRTKLVNANLKQACLCGADLKFANLLGADLRNANFGSDNVGGSTQLQGTNLQDCLVDGAIFNQATYDAETKFPKDFDPIAHGMLFAK